MVVQKSSYTGDKICTSYRHEHEYMIVPSCKLQDLNISKPWLEPDVFQTSIDLTPMFHHVKLNSSMFTYFIL